MGNSSEKGGLSVEKPAANGAAVVRHYEDGSLWLAKWNSEGLQTLEPALPDAHAEFWIAPGLLDLQVNGYAGVDFQRDCDAKALRHAADALQRDGCHRALLTIITCPWDQLLNRISRLRQILRGDAGLSRTFPGWHIEGPFLSDQPGFSGAHHPEWMSDPSPERIRELKAIVENDPLLITFAPEREGSIDAIREATRSRFVVSFGHSNVSARQLHDGVKAGGRAFTHLGNGCPQLLDRHDNIIWRALDEPSLVAGLIPDGHHVSPPLFRILHRALGSSRIYWTTDAVSAAGGPPGRYSIGEIELEVGVDGVVRNPATKSFAGSALTPMEGIRRGAQMLGLSWREVWNFFSIHPARLMNLPGELAPGSPAGFCLLRGD